MKVITLRKLVFKVLWIGFFCLYYATASRYVAGYADAEDITLAAYFGGLAHPPGYLFLTDILGKFIKLFSFDSPVFIANIFAALVQSLSGALVFLLGSGWLMRIKVEKKVAIISSILGTILWGISIMSWTHGVVIEVFPLSQVFLLLFWYFLMELSSKDVEVGRWWKLMGVSLLAAMAIFYHYLTLPLVIVSIYYFVIGNKVKSSKFKITSILLLTITFFGLLFLTYSKIDSSKVIYSWNQGDSIGEWVSFFTRKSYVDGGSAIESYAGEFDVRHSLVSIVELIKFEGSNFSWMGLGLMALGIALVILARGFKSSRWILVSWFVYGPVLAWYLKMPDAIISTDTEYYWGRMLRYRMFYVEELLAAMLMMLGVSFLIMRLSKMKLVMVRNSLILVVVGLLSLLFWLRYGQMDMSEGNFVHFYTKTILESLPDDALLIVDADLVFSFLYQQMVGSIGENVDIMPARIQVRPGWWESKRGELYELDYEDTQEMLIHTISYSLDSNRRVFLYDPDTLLLSQLGVVGNPLFAVPRGYLIEVADSVPSDFEPYDYGLSKQLVDYKVRNVDWWVMGQKGQLSSIHTQIAYYSKLLGLAGAGEVHETLALDLVSLPKTRKTIESTMVEVDEIIASQGYYRDYDVPSYESYINLGDESMSKGKLEETYYWYTRALILDPMKVQAHGKLMEYYILVGDEEKAIDELNRVRTLSVE